MKIFLYLVITYLFLGCGSSTSSGSQDDTMLRANVSNPILVVKGMKKDIKLFLNRQDITYNVLNNEGSDRFAMTDKNNGVLTYWAVDNNIDTVESIIVEAQDDEGWKSEPLTLSFKVVSDDILANRPVLETGANDGGSGKEQIFNKNDDGTVTDPFENIWEDKLESEQLQRELYIVAENRCNILQLKHQNSHWRVPTVSELLNLIDYSKPSGANMLNNIFEDINLTTWAQLENDKYLVVSHTSGVSAEAEYLDKYPVRCINAPKEDENHIVSSGAGINSITYDFSTALKWSPMTNDLYTIEQNASQYCSEYRGDGLSGWRLPSINELRSIVENGYIPNSISKGYMVAVSSTPYNNSDNNARLSYFSIVTDPNGGISQSVLYEDILHHVTCVKGYSN